jgi:hypothetical protein
VREFGFDSGYFKGVHNFDALDAWRGTDRNPRFALIEFGSGLWIEPMAQWYADECERKGLLWGSWFFPYAHITPKDLVSLWLKTPRSPHFPRQVDYERSPKYASIPSASHLLETCQRIEQAEGEAVIIYSRKELVDKNLATMSTDDLNLRWWWLAQYGADRKVEDTRPVLVPVRVRREMILFHQTADKGAPPPGFTPNAKSMDWDRWVGFMPIEQFAHSPNPPAKTIPERVAALETQHQPGGAHL